MSKEKAITDENALKVVHAIKATSDAHGVKIIQEIAEVAQEKIIAYIRELKAK